MDSVSFEHLTLRLGRLISRRATLGGLGALILPGLVDARKKKRKKKKCKPRCADCPQPKPEPTCVDFCAPECVFCFNRPDSAPLCGNGFSTTGCNPCSSDNDCNETATPYCATHRTELASGQRIRWDGPAGSCPSYSVGICISAPYCGQAVAGASLERTGR